MWGRAELMAQPPMQPSSWDRVRVSVDVDVLGGIEFISPSMEPHQADILLLELSRGPFKVMKARVIDGDPQ